jgi:hypothetical protein
MQTHLAVSLSPLLDATLDPRVLMQSMLMQLALFATVTQILRLAITVRLTAKSLLNLKPFLK